MSKKKSYLQRDQGLGLTPLLQRSMVKIKRPSLKLFSLLTLGKSAH
jgi:hypothetical protein